MNVREVMIVFEGLQDMKILLVDDDQWIRDSLSMFFLGHGIRIDALETAEEGVEILKQRQYDIVITDYSLPGMDGLSFLKHTQTLCPESFKVLITAFGSIDTLMAAADVGVNEYIEKPFTSRDIRETLSRMMKKRSEGKA